MNTSYDAIIFNIQDALSAVIEALDEFEMYFEQGDVDSANALIDMTIRSIDAVNGVFINHLTLNDAIADYILDTKNSLLCLKKIETETIMDSVFIAKEHLFYLIYFAKNYNKELTFTAKKIECNHDKKNIMFVPYKASMWDSFDSIYNAVTADESCNVYVVCTPYLAKINYKPTEYIYEGYDLPDNIEVIHWLSPIIHNINFDAIYFHNAYDNLNNITQVYTKFQSLGLKKWCKKLIYSQYAIGIDSFNNIEEFNDVFSSLHFYTRKLTDKADISLCNSATEKEFLELQGYDSNKLFLSSPKLDYAKMHCIKHKKIPQKWQGKLIGKKVFLLGLSIDSYTSSFNVIIDIINHLAKDKETGLIFRPHPLILSHFKNQNTVLFNHLANAIEFVKQQDNCVYDNSSNYIDAYNASDAFINDSSSLLPMYMLTEKPIYQLLIPYANKKHHILDFSGCYDADKGVSLTDFYALVKTGNDYLKQDRLERFHSSTNGLLASQETSGSLIHNHVMKLL